MPRATKHLVEFANLHVTAGTWKLVDLLDVVVLPAIFSTERRKHGTTAYVFNNPAVVDLPDGQHGVVFEFVKDTLLRREQRFEDGALIEDHDSMESAPSGIALLIFENHRIVYVPKTAHAPSLHQLERTLDTLFRRHRSIAVQRVLSNPANERPRRDLEQLLPPIQVKLIPLTSSESVGQTLDRLTKIKTIQIDLVKTNNEFDGDRTYRSLQETALAAHAKRARITYRNSKDGLAASVAREEVTKATAQGVATVAVSGEDADGDEVTKTNDDMRVRPPANFEVTTPKETAPPMATTLGEMVKKGILTAAQNATEGANAKIQSVLEKWKTPTPPGQLSQPPPSAPPPPPRAKVKTTTSKRPR